MQRTALVSGLVAALLIVSPLWADEAPPPGSTVPPASGAPDSGSAAGKPPAGGVAPSIPTAAPPPSSAPAAPSVTPSSEATPDPAPAPAPPPVPPASAPVAPPPVIPAPSAVQSVAPETAEAILGQRVTEADGKDLGRLVDVLVDVNGFPQAAIIDFGGFMGVGNRKIAVHWSALHFSPGDPKHRITLEMTPDQIKAAPEFLNPNKAASVVTPTEPAPSSP